MVPSYAIGISRKITGTRNGGAKSNLNSSLDSSMFVRVDFEVTILTIHDHLERDSSLATRRNLRLLTEVEVKFNGTRRSLDARHPVVGRD